MRCSSHETLPSQIIHKGIGDINDNDGQLYQQRPEISQIVGCGVQDVTKEHLEVCAHYTSIISFYWVHVLTLSNALNSVN